MGSLPREENSITDQNAIMFGICCPNGPPNRCAFARLLPNRPFCSAICWATACTDDHPPRPSPLPITPAPDSWGLPTHGGWAGGGGGAGGGGVVARWGGSGPSVSGREGNVGGGARGASMAAVLEGEGDEGRGKGEKCVCVKLTGVERGTVATL